MSPRKEYEYAEVMVDRLLLESFANEQSPYHNGAAESLPTGTLRKLRHRLKWHIRNTLSARQKQVIEYYLSGKTEREIARTLGITQQVVNIYKHRAIKKLHKIFAS
ncbi:MAG: response regulator transcription factor [Candidatus Zixiibacteriota bacterium]|nr:MAG: response regulator transcription factor [candidate division Zixibacteria bacterium]